MSASHLSFATRAIHAGQAPDPSTGAIMTPVYLTSTYAQSAPGEHLGYEYSRTQNPTRAALEANLAALEEARYGLCFASGCAAMSTLLHLLRSGDHVLCSDDVYGGTFRILDKVFAQMGIETTFVDMTDIPKLRQAVRPNTKMLWLETPTNPLLKIIDLTQVAQVAQSHQLISVCDNTFATPYLQRPLAHGFDLVVHSSTKYLGGHSDVVGGVVLTQQEALHNQIAFLQNAIGAVPGPMDCFLLLRSTKTLHVRMQRHCENAQQLAEWLSAHPDVERVIYPGLKSHPQHELAKAQMRGFGGMISFYLKGDLASSRRFLQNVKLFTCAESLGGVESLIEHPAIMTHAALGEANRAKLGISDTLIRASVGIEDAADLIHDLEHALQAMLRAP